MPQVLEYSDVVVRRNARDIIDHLDWSVNDDERWVILGPNGAGKTTLLQMADTMMHPTSGSVTVLGERLGRSDVFELRPRIGFASSALARRVPPGETVLNVVLTAAFSVLGRWREDYEDIDERRALRVLAEWNLDDLADRTFGTLSDGERKRVSIARALATKPKVLLMDEPFAALDEITRLKLNNDLLSLWEKQRLTVIFVTHSVFESAYLSDRIVVMAARPGRVIADIGIDAPYPRTEAYRTSSAYNEYCKEVSGLLKQAMAGVEDEH